MSEKVNPLVFNRQDKIEIDEERKNTDDLKFKGLHDHSKCIQANDKEINVDHDANLIENEGDPLEEFDTDEKSNSHHARCKTVWLENWEDAADEEELSEKLPRH